MNMLIIACMYDVVYDVMTLCFCLLLQKKKNLKVSSIYDSTNVDMKRLVYGLDYGEFGKQSLQRGRGILKSY